MLSGEDHDVGSTPALSGKFVFEGDTPVCQRVIRPRGTPSPHRPPSGPIIPVRNGVAPSPP